MSPLPSSLPEAATGEELEAAGWLTTTSKGTQRDYYISQYMASFFATEIARSANTTIFVLIRIVQQAPLAS